LHKVSLLLPFRDNAGEVPAAIRRVASLDFPPAQLRVICIEGDSVDDTWRLLTAWQAADNRVTLVKCTTGQPHYGSIIHPGRFAVLAQVFNTGLDAVDLEWSTHVLMLPSDIAYAPDLLQRLLAHDVDMVAPLIWLGDIFYDTWGFVHAGRHFTNFRRAEADWRGEHTLLPMDSVGGVLLMRSEVLRAGCRYSPEDVDRGLCRAARGLGFRVWADPMTGVEHPIKRA